MKKLISFLLCTLVLTSTLTFSAFASDSSSEKTVLRVYNWGEYISDGSDGTLDVLAEFEEQNPDIEVEYTTYASNEEMYAKIKSGSANYDVIIPSDYMISRMINEDMLLPLDYDNIPNYADIMDNFKGLSFDPNNEYSVPYSWGTVCLIVNTSQIEDDITSWSALWNEKYDNDILMFNNSRDAFGIAQKLLGFSQNTTDETELEQCKDALIEQKSYLQSYVMDEIFDKMESGEAAIAPYYTGDGLIMAEENPDLEIILPEEGTNLFVDAMVIPKGAKNKEAAERFINFMCEPEIGMANVVDYLGYSTPLKSVYEQLDEEILNDGLSYPSDEYLAKCDTYINLPDDTNKEMEDMWVDIMAAEVGADTSVFSRYLLGAIFIGLLVIAIVRTVLSRRKKALEI